MMTFLLILTFMGGLAKVQEKHSPEFMASRIDNGTATKEEKDRFMRYVDRSLERAERRAKKNR